MRLFLLGFLLSFSTLWGASFHDFDLFQNQFSQQEMENKIKKYLQKDPQISSFYRLTPEALYIGDLKEGKIDYVLHLTKTPLSRPKKRPISLQNAKIAIDPGHFGSDLAELEERQLTITKGTSNVCLSEGTLTYLTAMELKALLEREGVQVLVTRPVIGQGALSETFSQWLQNHKEFSNLTLAERFKIYHHEDLRARAEKINQFAPHITIIIHYNIDDEVPKGKLSSDNFTLAFIPGSFCLGELNTKEDRLEFLRLLVTDDLEQSLQLSQEVAREMEKRLKIPPAQEKISYLEQFSLRQSPGVYSRNLAMTRLIHGPLCYGESLLQNNEQEFERLSTNESKMGQNLAPLRVKEVAAAYFEAIKSYFHSLPQ